MHNFAFKQIVDIEASFAFANLATRETRPRRRRKSLSSLIPPHLSSPFRHSHLN